MSGRMLRLVCTAAVAAQAALAPVSATAAPEPPAPARRSVTALLTDLQRLYRQAEQATRTYDAVAGRLVRQCAETGRLDAALTRARLSLDDSRAAAGRLARQQYQGSTGISPYVRLLLARDPQHALDEGHVIAQLARRRADTVRRLTGDERTANGLVRRARTVLDGQLALAGQARKARDEVRARLGDLERLLASLGPAQLSALAAFERNGAAGGHPGPVTSAAPAGTPTPAPQPGPVTSPAPAGVPTSAAQPGPVASGAPGGAPAPAPQPGPATSAAPAGTPTPAPQPGPVTSTAPGGAPTPGAPGGIQVVRYALPQVGEPYQWGAGGPTAYDCPGLIWQAGGRAGVPGPGTGQEKPARRMPLGELGPGYLVVYFPDARQVALRLGDGSPAQGTLPGPTARGPLPGPTAQGTQPGPVAQGPELAPTPRGPQPGPMPWGPQPGPVAQGPRAGQPAGTVPPSAANPVPGAVRPGPGGEPPRR